MNIILPPPPPSYSSASIGQIFDTIKRALIPAISKDEAAHRILLQSPNGTVYEVKVQDNGTLQTSVNSGNSRL